MYMRGDVVVNAWCVKWKDRVMNLDLTIAFFPHSKNTFTARGLLCSPREETSKDGDPVVLKNL